MKTFSDLKAGEFVFAVTSYMLYYKYKIVDITTKTIDDGYVYITLSNGDHYQIEKNTSSRMILVGTLFSDKSYAINHLKSVINRAQERVDYGLKILKNLENENI
jgi:hypothetical protein